MEEEWYLALLGYIKRQKYPAGLTKSQKYSLRRASKNYQVVGDQLHYIDLNVDEFQKYSVGAFSSFFLNEPPHCLLLDPLLNFLFC